ncbi:DegV family protein [Clostridiaceae bacterium]|nr:DegV family protein [Clostridiaceae bacterium]
MEYRIIGDSCLDLPAELKGDPHFRTIPLTLQVGETEVIDDAAFDQASFLRLVKETDACPKTACPSPESFKEAFDCDADWIFVITLSSHLSGSYNSAVLGKRIFEEERGQEKRIAVIDSESASAGELNIALRIQELCAQGLSFDEVVEQAEEYRDHLGTYFVLESLDYLRKNGRLTGLKAFIATTLNIKPVMASDHGVIVKLDQERGLNKALSRMARIAVERGGDTSGKRLVISHCNNRARAERVRDELLASASFRDVVITDTAGVATVYAGDGGIIVTL